MARGKKVSPEQDLVKFRQLAGKQEPDDADMQAKENAIL